jgi:hypothetical protein
MMMMFNYIRAIGTEICRNVLRDNEDLAAVQRWSMENGLLLNNAKTQAMIICRDHGRLPSPVPSLRLGGCNIPYSSSLRNLGLIMLRHPLFAGRLALG